MARFATAGVGWYGGGWGVRFSGCGWGVILGLGWQGLLGGYGYYGLCAAYAKTRVRGSGVRHARFYTTAAYATTGLFRDPVYTDSSLCVAAGLVASPDDLCPPAIRHVRTGALLPYFTVPGPKPTGLDAAARSASGGPTTIGRLANTTAYYATTR